MQNHLIRFAFNGAAYHGFQVQANAPTVCAAMQHAMEPVLGCRPNVKGVSRTDAGVHARDFCLSFKCDTHIPPEKLPLALNSRLPGDIRVFSARRVPDAFHARYSAAGKEYRYHILNSPVDDPFTQGFYYRVPQPIDAGAMAQAAGLLEGRHDFKSFRSENGLPAAEQGGTVRTIQYCRVERQGPRLTVVVAADGFLYHMVRILAGVLLEVGLGRMEPEAIPGLLGGQQAGQAGQAGPTLPAKGLFLHKVFYPEAAFVD